VRVDHLHLRRARDFSELSHYRARYYDPNTGRFVSEDPLLFFAGGTDFYAYSYNDPPNLGDPSGLAPGLLDRLLDRLKPTPTPPSPCPPKANCDPDGYREATPSERSRVLAAAAAEKGKPYGGKGPNSFDCSGLVCFAIQHSVNPSFPNQSAQPGINSMQNPQPGLSPIDPSQGVPGDLVLFPGHVGIYDPNSGRNDLLSATQHGVRTAPRGGFDGPQQFLRLRIPCYIPE
jgi:RHS repeat-associated protein